MRLHHRMAKHLTRLSLMRLECRLAPAAPQFVGSAFFGGAGDQNAQDIAYRPSTQNVFVAGHGTTSALWVRYDTSLAGPISHSIAGSTQFNAVTTSTDGIQAVGNALPPAAGAVDGVGGTEIKTMLSISSTDNFSAVTSKSANYNSYTGAENWISSAVANEGGSNFIYASGYAQANGANNSAIVSKFTALGAPVWNRTPGNTGAFNNSGGQGIVAVGSYVYVAGNTHYPYTDPTALRATLWQYGSDGATGWTKALTESSLFLGGATHDGAVYGVGRLSAGGSDFLISRFDTAGNLVWSKSSGGAGADSLEDAVGIGSHLYAVGYTTSQGGGGNDIVLLEIDPVTGATIHTVTFGGAQDDRAYAITTDGLDLFIAGESRSFANGGNAVGQNDMLVLKYSIGPPTVRAVTVNDGAAQRSRVTSLAIDFDRLVTLPANPANAFTLVRDGDSAPVTLSAVVSGTVATRVTLTFTGGPVEFTSLEDGRYTLTTLSAQVTDGQLRTLDGNSDGTAGDNNVFQFHRLFGDVDGDANIDASDFAPFRQVYGGSSFAFDFDNDGDVDSSDFGAFRGRFGMTI